MRIISKFKDYYDHAGVVFDTDKKRTYIRKMRVIEDPKKHKFIRADGDDPLTYESTIQYLGFCGKIYQITNLYGRVLKYNMAGPTLEDMWTPISSSDIKLLKKEFLIIQDENEDPVYCTHQHGDKKQLDISKLHKSKNIQAFIKQEKERFNLGEEKDWWYRHNRRDDKIKKMKHYFKELNTPIFYKPCPFRIVTNVPLEPFLFHRIMSPQQAYQELDMFLVNELFNIEKDSDQSDLNKAQSHGFDKESFRKPKQKK